MGVEVFSWESESESELKNYTCRVESRSRTEKKKNGVGVGVELKKYLRVRVGVRVVSISLRLANPEKNSQKLLYLIPIGRRPIEAVPKLNGEFTLKILFGLASVPHQSIYPSSNRIEILGCSNSSSFPRDLSTMSGPRKVS